ncbi:MAG: DNA-3-methyladenine glycosylase [Actinomycetota bacterium]
MTPVDRELLAGDSVDVAPQLLGKVLRVGPTAGRIVEVEAYRQDDPASHSHRGRTTRTATMFGRPGLLYVYRSYGIHWCANVVTGAVDEGAAVLIRALEPIDGLDAMRARRPAARRDRDLCAGPGRLTAALGIDGAHDGVDLVAVSSAVELLDDTTPPPAEPTITTRVGISVATEQPWRWLVPDDPHRSPGRGATLVSVGSRP